MAEGEGIGIQHVVWQRLASGEVSKPAILALDAALADANEPHSSCPVLRQKSMSIAGACLRPHFMLASNAQLRRYLSESAQMEKATRLLFRDGDFSRPEAELVVRSVIGDILLERGVSS